MLVCVRVFELVYMKWQSRGTIAVLYEIGLNVFKHITQLCQQSTFRTLDVKLLLCCVVLCYVVLCCCVLFCCVVVLLC